MDLVLITTSHGQVNQVEKLLSSLADLVKISSDLNVHCILTESFLSTKAHDHLVTLYSSIFQSLTILPLSAKNYWTGSVFCGLTFASSLEARLKSVENSRVVVVNCDVLPSSWEFLLYPKSCLETLVTMDPNCIVQRSGFQLFTPFFALHNYPHCNQTLPSHDWSCLSVPTRLVVFPFHAVKPILSCRFISKYLPHYAADFVLTSFLSSTLSTSWLVRVDSFLLEDLSTTGFKNSASINMLNLQSTLLSRKSVFNVFDAFYFPILFARLSLPAYCFPTYVLTSWLKYLSKIIFFIVRNMFSRLYPGNLL